MRMHVPSFIESERLLSKISWGAFPMSPYLLRDIRCLLEDQLADDGCDEGASAIPRIIARVFGW